MSPDPTFAPEIAMIRRALADLERLMAAADPADRQRFQEIKQTLESALQAARRSCACATSPARVCALTGIPV
jgi:hypothetical protein